MTDYSTRQDSSYCGNHPQLDHTHCPSSVECAHAMCDACGLKPSGYGHFTLYCVDCSGDPVAAAQAATTVASSSLLAAFRAARDEVPATEARVCAAQPVPADRYLTQLEAQCRIARQALADEHEGNFTRAVQLIQQDADELGSIVSQW